MKPTLEVILSNSLIKYNSLQGKIVVFIDVLRNTSVMTTALFSGIKKVKPVATVEEAKSYLGKQNFVCAGERDAIKLPEMDYGNSPYDYLNNKKIVGKTLVITSTNGTQSVSLAKAGEQLICGAIVNEAKVCEFLLAQNKPTVLLASGWKGKVNVEDTLCCGLIANKLQIDFTFKNDACLIAEALYKSTNNDFNSLIKKTSHYYRIANQKQMKDVDFCLQKNAAPVLPIFDGEFLVAN